MLQLPFLISSKCGKCNSFLAEQADSIAEWHSLALKVPYVGLVADRSTVSEPQAFNKKICIGALKRLFSPSWWSFSWYDQVVLSCFVLPFPRYGSLMQYKRKIFVVSLWSTSFLTYISAMKILICRWIHLLQVRRACVFLSTGLENPRHVIRRYIIKSWLKKALRITWQFSVWTVGTTLWIVPRTSFVIGSRTPR